MWHIETKIVIYAAVFLITAYCAYIDYKRYLIPNKITIPAILLGLLYHLTLGAGLVFSFKGVALGFLVLIYAVITNKVGAGDGKLLMAIGSWLGWLPVIFVASLSLVLGFVWFKVIDCKIKSSIPFGPCIFISTVISMIL